MKEFNKTLVFTDLHGDLNIMAKSFANFGIMKYNAEEFDDLETGIKKSATEENSEYINSLIIKQNEPVRLMLLGDYVDRNNYGYHIIEFLKAIEWENYNIHPIFLMGNHDLLNLFFFTNPYKFHVLYKHTGANMKQITEFLESIQLIKSYNSFIELHKEEIIKLQTQFFENQEIELPLSNYSIKLKYNRDYTNISKLICPLNNKKAFFEEFSKITGINPENDDSYYGYSESRFFSSLESKIFNYTSKYEGRNYFLLATPSNECRAYYGNIGRANFFKHQIDENTFEVQFVDWRIISYVWRKHYGDFFRNIKYWYLENSILYTHGGLSPQAMVDSFTFAPIYDVAKGKIKE